MDWKKITVIAAVALFIVLCGIIGAMSVKIERLVDERDRYKSNTETLLDTVATYRTRDSLSAAQVGVLKLTLDEYKKYRSEDAALIKTLKAKNRELQAVNTTQAETILELESRPKDTVLVNEGVETLAKVVRCGDEWFDFEGVLTKDEFRGKLANREALLITETVKYKRFLGFLWKCGVKDRKVDVVSQNPHTTIIFTEHIVVSKK